MLIVSRYPQEPPRTSPSMYHGLCASVYVYFLWVFSPRLSWGSKLLLGLFYGCIPALCEPSTSPQWTFYGCVAEHALSAALSSVVLRVVGLVLGARPSVGWAWWGLVGFVGRRSPCTCVWTSGVCAVLALLCASSPLAMACARALVLAFVYQCYVKLSCRDRT